MMQKVATRVFILSSIAFGILGIVVVIAASNSNDGGEAFMNVLAADVFIILASFAVSFAGKYLSNKA